MDKDTYYFKVDEDVVYIGEGAIEAMVEEALRNRFLFLSANVINHALLSHVHSRLGALQVQRPPPPLLAKCTCKSQRTRTPAQACCRYRHLHFPAVILHLTKHAVTTFNHNISNKSNLERQLL
jgi:hypothetical protein